MPQCHHPRRIDELLEALARYARQPEAQGTSKIIADDSAPADAEAVNSDESLQVLMDWSRLEQFQEFDDEDRRMTREVIALFASGALSRAAHVLKGAASNVGAQAMSGLASQTCQALQAWAQAV